MRCLIRTVYRFREATLVAEKKDDFGNALQNLYRSRSEPKMKLSPPDRPSSCHRSAPE
jgi:hypothetical protein